MICRLILLALVAAVLAPGTWVRNPEPRLNLTAAVKATQLEFPSEKLGRLKVLAAWELTSEHSYFGGFSGLAALGDGRILSVSDRGAAMRFQLDDDCPGKFRLERVGDPRLDPDKFSVDIESLTHDPVTGQLWLAYEGLNMIERRDARLDAPKRIRPDAMKRWPGNSGPEAMVRLADGRFIVLGEGTSKWFDDAYPALLWSEDPTEGKAPLEFAIRPPAGYRATDMVELPDGRVLVLIRKLALGLLPFFEIGLMVFDPATIESGEVWEGAELARFAPPFPTDNYEGLAIDPATDFPVTLTLISDDNSVQLQRTLLLRLQWDGKTPPTSSAPSAQ